MSLPLPTQVTCPHCGAFAFPTDQAVRASQSGASWSTATYKCAGPDCFRFVQYSPISGRVEDR